MTQKSKVIGLDDSKDKLIRNEWAAFSKTTAFKEMMEYADNTSDMLLRDATDISITIDGKRVAISGEMMNFLLQRKAGIAIMTTYIRVYSE